MTKQELTERFETLYNYMAVSNNTRYMRTFGETMKRMMAWFIDNKTEAAEDFMESLCSIRWRQYLTKGEAMEIVGGMVPAAAWDYPTWERAMEGLHLEWEREGVFNCYALWVVMNSIHSDNGNVIAHLLGMETCDAGDERYIKATHSMAMNMLLDEDGRYSVRKYFLE